MRKIKKTYFSTLMSFALLAALPAFATEYMSAESFADANGVSHQWFPIQKMLIMRKGLASIKFKIGESTAIINEKETRISDVPRIQNKLIYVPADVLQKVFPGSKAVQKVQLNSRTHTGLPTSETAINNQPLIPTQQERVSQKNANTEDNSIATTAQANRSADSILIALRHSLREDHTRVVLEFSSPVTYKAEFNKGTYRLNIDGCKNLIPTKRTNPVGRDVARLDLNSGVNREGLVLTFILTQKDKEPSIETVADPFRMIVILPIGSNLFYPETATATANVLPSKINTSNEKPIVTPITAAKPVEIETPPEINIEVPIESLQNQAFLGRTVVIDPGHGGSDTGFSIPGRPAEKDINLETARLLKSELEAAGFKAALLRNSDISMDYLQRLSLANKNGGDLYISIHTGGSNDKSKQGVACYIFGNAGIWHNSTAQGVNYDAVFEEWLKTTRFDLAEFMAKKINNRLIKHLHVESRGVNKSPLLPLKFIMNPAVLVEIGMLSDKVEGKNLISDKYKLAIAKSITNGIIDFFNGIEMK